MMGLDFQCFKSPDTSGLTQHTAVESTEFSKT